VDLWQSTAQPVRMASIAVLGGHNYDDNTGGTYS